MILTLVFTARNVWEVSRIITKRGGTNAPAYERGNVADN